jgi:hypothetical protein
MMSAAAGELLGVGAHGHAGQALATQDGAGALGLALGEIGELRAPQRAALLADRLDAGLAAAADAARGDGGVAGGGSGWRRRRSAPPSG